MPLFGSRKAHPARPTDILERPDYGWVWKPLLGLVAVYLAVTLALGVWWSLTPEGFDVQRASAEQRGRLASERSASAEPVESTGTAGSADSSEAADEVATSAEASGATTAPLDTSPAGRGAVITATQVTLIDTLIDKPGGYLRNDMLPPGLWLDNMPAWELGVLRQARGLAHALVEKGGTEEGALLEARERLDGDSQDWLYPSTERRLAKARDAYVVVLGELNDQRLALPAEGDVPAYWLSRVARRLDELTYRLSASVADPEALRELEVDVDQLPGRTPWYRVDDIFFEARGQAWALEHLLAAMVADYGDVVATADAEALVERLRAELEQAQRRLWSPMVLNGTGFGIFANHSLMMAAYTQRAAQLAEALSGRLAGVSAAVVPASEPSVDEAGAQSDAQPAPQPASAGKVVAPAGAAKVGAEEVAPEAPGAAPAASGESGDDEPAAAGVSADASSPAEPTASSAGNEEANAGEQAAGSADEAGATKEGG